MKPNIITEMNRIILTLSLCIIVLSGCIHKLGEDIDNENSSSNNTQEIINTETLYITEIMSGRQNTSSTDLCAYVWTSRTLPELSAQIQDDFIIEGFDHLKINAEAYGENCIDPATNKVKYFTAMQTDFHITFAVNDLSDDVVGNYLYEIIKLLSEYPEETLPGSMPGHIGIRFGRGNDDRYFWFAVNEGLDAVDRGYKGRTLVTILE